MYTVKVENLTKTYQDLVAVDGISFEVDQGEIFGLLGPNGAGKTTTLECLEGLRKPDGGVIRVANLDPWLEQPKLRSAIGVQLQSAGLPESITPAEAMKIFCAYRKKPPRSDLLERFGLMHKRQTQFCELSSGQQRRLALALSVAHDPQVLFLDEPTAGLDVASRVELHKLIRELKEHKITVLLATHDMAEAEELSDRVAILLNGKISTIGTPLQITAASAGLTRISVQTQNASLSGLSKPFPAVRKHLVKDGYHILFSLDIGPTLSAIIDHIQFNQDPLLDLRVERPSLEDCFLEITRTSALQEGAAQ